MKPEDLIRRVSERGEPRGADAVFAEAQRRSDETMIYGVQSPGSTTGWNRLLPPVAIAAGLFVVSMVIGAALRRGDFATNHVTGAENVSAAASEIEAAPFIKAFPADLETVIRKRAYTPMPSGCDRLGALPHLRQITSDALGEILDRNGNAVAVDGRLVDVSTAGSESLRLVDIAGPDRVETDGGATLQLDGEAFSMTADTTHLDLSVQSGPQKYAIERYERKDAIDGWTRMPDLPYPSGTVGPATLLVRHGGALYGVIADQERQQQGNLYRFDKDGSWKRVTDLTADGDLWATISSLELIQIAERPALLVTQARGNAQGYENELSTQPVVIDADTGEILATGPTLAGDSQFVNRGSDGALVIEIPMRNGGLRVSTTKPEHVLGCGRSGSRALGLGSDPDSPAGGD